MSRIANFLLVPSQDPAGIESISVGLVFADHQIAWGLCQDAGDLDLPDHPDGFRLADARSAISETIIPAFQDRPLTSFRPLARQLAGLTEAATIHRIIPQRPSLEPGKLSRRDLFTGLTRSGPLAGPEKTRKERLTIERRLHPALRHGLGQALLMAVAEVRKRAMTEVIVSEYGFSQPAKPPLLLLELDREQESDAELWHRPTAIGLNLSGDPVSQLGKGGGRLASLARQLNESLARISDQTERPVVHFAFDGTLGQLHEHNTGKILGGLYGLERAIGPYPLWASDPVVMASRSAQIEKMAELKELIRMRGMAVRISARAWIDSLDDVRAFLAADAAHAIHLDMRRLGGVGEAVEAALAARERGVKVLLTGGEPALLGQVALALQPEWVAVDPAGTFALRREMDRALAWMAVRTQGG